VTTPPQEIHADHVNMIRPADRKSAAYDFFYRVYRANPILETSVITRDAVIPALEAGCQQTSANPDLPVPIALNSAMHEKVLSAAARFIHASDLHDVNPNPPAVTRIDPNGVVHVQYSFSGPSKKLFVCLGAAHASLQVEFSIEQQTPVREPGN